MGEEYLTLRKKYGLTQQMASKVFGKGIIAFSRYENEETYPDKTTSLLVETAIERPDVLKRLADKAGVNIPLWKERCEDEQRIKVRPFPVTGNLLSNIVREKVEYHAESQGTVHAQHSATPRLSQQWKSVSLTRLSVDEVYSLKMGVSS
jgi:HTH-type transcriptional regulator/antitoxin MqsA